MRVIQSGVMVSTIGIAGFAQAGTLMFSQSLTNGAQSASVLFVFDDSTDKLTITLTNTMSTNGGPQWLTGLFWNLTGADGFTIAPHAADPELRVEGDLITLSGTTQTDYGIAEEGHFWAYRDDISDYGSFLDTAFGGTTRAYGLGAAGFSAAGFDMFSQSNILNFQDNPAPQPDGADGGILADIGILEVPGGHEGKPFALGSLTYLFDLTGFDAIADSGLAVVDVAFVFGTGFDETVLIPLPPAVWAGAIGLVGVVALRRRTMLA